MSHSLTFEGLPAYSWPGGAIAGTVVLQTDDAMRATDLDLMLHGREVSQVTVQAGKSREVLVETSPFLELTSTFQGAIAFSDADHIAPGTYRLPFHFDVPADAEPSLETTDRPAQRGRFESRPDGMYVEFELEARVRVPWWFDEIDKVVVPVFSARRVLGRIPPIASPVAEPHPSFQVQFDQPMILPGTPVSGSFTVANPSGKDLRELDIRLFRHVEYTTRGHSGVRDGPETSVALSLGGRQSAFSGTFSIPCPNTRDMTGPFHGRLYRTWWIAEVRLRIPLGFDLKMQASFTPV